MYDDFFGASIWKNVHNERLAYGNLYNVPLRMITDWENIGRTDQGPEPHNAPYTWFEVSFWIFNFLQINYYEDTIDEDNLPPIRCVTQLWADRKDYTTRETINQALSHVDRNQHYWEFESPTNFDMKVNEIPTNQKEKDYYALLQTPGVRGTLQMCWSYTEDMRWPIIRKITIFYHKEDNSYSLIMELLTLHD